jgi:hypothetical protein
MLPSRNHKVVAPNGFLVLLLDANFIVTGSSFCPHHLIVMVRGSKDLRDMLRSLKDKSARSEEASYMDTTYRIHPDYRTSWVTVLNCLALKLFVSMKTVLELFAS